MALQHSEAVQRPPTPSVVAAGNRPAVVAASSVDERFAQRPGLRVYLVVKRCIDVCVALALLLALSPVMVAVAVVLCSTEGRTVLFRQTRIGWRGRPFSMLKFRTMRGDRRACNEGPPQGSTERRKRHKSKADPRVTPVGQFLRRTCIDELPQLWNVLVGDMSLVGPRPEMPSIVATYEPWQHERHDVRPGITGWWQINRSRSSLMYQETQLDIYYVRHQSWHLDVIILLKTIPFVVKGSGIF